MSEAASQDLKTRARARDRHHKTKRPGVSFRETTKGRTYYVYWRGSYKRAGTTEREAIALQSDLRGKAARGERIILSSKLTFGDVAEQWWASAQSELRPGWRKETRRMLDKAVLPEWGDRKIGSFSPADPIELDRKLRARGLSSSTAANYLKPSRSVFDYAVLKGYIPSSPFTDALRGRLSSCNTTKEQREWTSADVAKLIEAGYARDERDTARSEYGLAIELKLRSGARLGELLGARYGDFDYADGVWNLTTQWTKDSRVDVPKTKKSIRRIPLAPDLVRKIAERKLRLGAGDETFVFATRNGNPPTHGNWRSRGWNKAVALAGLTGGPKVTPHSARHALASALADQGLSSADVSELLGHSGSAITERVYVHAFNRDAREARVREAMVRAQNDS